jgi:phosphatidylserine decarboxylase
MNTNIQLFFQRRFFQKLSTSLLGKLANSQVPLIKNLFIRIFCRCYDIKMSEAVEENPLAYASFHDFFIRRLKSSARRISDNPLEIVSPADGTISQIGYLENDSLLQAKGKYYSVTQLLGGDTALASTFHNGAHALIYLAPNNYHRVHMPITGRLLQMIYVPGTLFSVSPTTAQHIDGLFAKNERIIALFDTALGRMAVILVGAMIVGSISTVWAGMITPPRNRLELYSEDYQTHNLSLEKGQELGYFSLGSTVIVLFEKDKVTWNEELLSSSIQMGQSIAKIQDYRNTSLA